MVAVASLSLIIFLVLAVSEARMVAMLAGVSWIIPLLLVEGFLTVEEVAAVIPLRITAMM